ncbi:rho GTPase-activating protein gacF [Episyrphus balteatus]|uniref:rho GTPase-activating protein gacF n=1 Tax=Episyrphus balteatus TaxID=286459 RepID=UPI002485A3F1|nr:rho GTPase-activating protein gacF [Episyrphus balteatus]
MATNRSKYISIYKIDGIPILPPLMTPEKRRQMLAFKELAIQLENARKKQHNFVVNKQSTITTTTTGLDQSSSCNLLRHGHSHIPQPSQTPRKQQKQNNSNEASTSTASTSKRERLDKLRKTDTLVYDNRANSIILTLEGFEDDADFQSMVLERPPKLDQNENKISPDVPKSLSPTKDESTSPQNPIKPQPYAAFIPIPSICVNPPTPSVQNNPICSTTTSKRLCGSPTLKADIESNLIRSNSFTLDGPSSALLEHIKNQKLKKSTATQDTVESKAKRVQKVEATKPKAKSPSSPSLNHFTNNTIIFRAKRSPYEMKPSSKTKLGRKHKIVKPITTPKKPNSNSSDISTISTMTPPQSTSNLDLLKDIEEQHRARFIELVRQQQIEQKRLQKEFETQQKLLLEQLSARVAKVQIHAGGTTTTTTGSPPSPTIVIDSAHSSPTSVSPEQESSSCSARVTPRRRLFLENIKDASAAIVRDPSPSPQSTGRRLVREENQRKRIHIAATVINAHARGYLTRRLFRTDYIQRIVQTIKDTLIFVINLHLETSGCDDSESSLKLKARLLKQLTSACRTLHSVFFETSTKDRMEIISRDRKFIQAKLLNIKSRSQKIVR